MFLIVIASLETCDDEFTVQEVSERTAQLIDKPFSPSHAGLVYKNRQHGKYSFAVPLLGRFIARQREA